MLHSQPLSSLVFQFVFLTPLTTDSIQDNTNDVHFIKLRKDNV